MCLVYAALGFGLLACGPAAAPTKPSTPPPQPTAAAEGYMRTGNYLAAAQAFEQLYSTTDDSKTERHRLRAVLAYADADQLEQAGLLLAQNPPANPAADPSADPLAERLRILATIFVALKANPASIEPASALTELQSVDPRNLSPYQKGVYHRSSSALAARQHDVVRRLNEGLAADRYPMPDTARAALHRDIWRAVLSLTPQQKNNVGLEGNNTTQAWLELHTDVTPVMHDSAQLSDVVSSWRNKHPSHPANTYIVEELFETAESLSAAVRHIALLLPFEGRYAEAAAAIRDGLVAAWFDDLDSAKPVVSIYSVTAETAAAQYANAVSNGADFVVGPLEKNDHRKFARSSRINGADSHSQ